MAAMEPDREDMDPAASGATAKSGWWRWPGRQRDRRSSRLNGERASSDVLLIAGGIALGLTCAFFPWYVFFNQEQFGIRAVKFGGNPGTGTLPASSVSAGHIAAPTMAEESGAPELDDLATGTLPGKDEPEEPPPGLAEQPFPAQAQEFRLVHVANGRAMIEDDKGLWLVQRGSILPDNTKVVGIVQRGERWVVLTSGDRVLEVAH